MLSKDEEIKKEEKRRKKKVENRAERDKATSKKLDALFLRALGKFISGGSEIYR